MCDETREMLRLAWNLTQWSLYKDACYWVFIFPPLPANRKEIKTFYRKKRNAMEGVNASITQYPLRPCLIVWDLSDPTSRSLQIATAKETMHNSLRTLHGFKRKNACYTGFEPATHGTGFRMDALQAMVFEQVARLVQLKQNVTVPSILASV